MNALLRHIALLARSRSGLGASVVVCYLIAALALAAAIVFGWVALFVWFADRYGTQIASLALAGILLLIAVVAAALGAVLRRGRMQRARLELAASRSGSWLDPKFATLALEIGRAIGWRRIVTLGAAGLFAAGLAREWSGRRRKGSDPPASEADN